MMNDLQPGTVLKSIKYQYSARGMDSKVRLRIREVKRYGGKKDEVQYRLQLFTLFPGKKKQWA